MFLCFEMMSQKKIYDQYKIKKCYLYVVFICELSCAVDKRKSRQIIFEVMIKNKKYLIDLIYPMIFGINLAIKIKI